VNLITHVQAVLEKLLQCHGSVSQGRMK
jgi:hypothetical protein